MWTVAWDVTLSRYPRFLSFCACSSETVYDPEALNHAFLAFWYRGEGTCKGTTSVQPSAAYFQVADSNRQATGTQTRALKKRDESLSDQHRGALGTSAPCQEAEHCLRMPHAAPKEVSTSFLGTSKKSSTRIRGAHDPISALH